MPVASSHFRRPTFLIKVAAVLALVWLADHLFFMHEPGWTLGLFALAWAIALAVAVPAVWRHRAGAVALAAALGYGALLVDDPGPLKWLMFWIALSVAAMLPGRRFDDAWQWALRLFVHGVSTAFAPIADLVRWSRLPRGPVRVRWGAAVRVAALPILGSLVFLSLFAAANPIIENVLAAVRLPAIGEMNIVRAMFWAFILFMTWPAFRPRAVACGLSVGGLAPEAALPSAPAATVTYSLVAFNLVFAVQNGLDLAFLWSGAPLPEGVTLADYAHRGAYPLIATALLAGLFVLVALRPGSATAGQKLVRRLVVVWVAQNVLLVASSILRTIDYVDAFSLTELRIAALAWMALVALGLMLICWRLLRGRSGAWLINANALAAGLVLSAGVAVDLGSVAAAWNVRHAREVDGTGAGLDLCYLRDLGPSALVPVARFEARLGDPGLLERVRDVRADLLDRTRRQQADWRQWTWRNARRLAAAEAALGDAPPRAAASLWGRDCHGRPNPPPPMPQTAAPAFPPKPDAAEPPAAAPSPPGDVPGPPAQSRALPSAEAADPPEPRLTPGAEQ